MFAAATAGVGAGSRLTPGLLARLGSRRALVATGAFLPALARLDSRRPRPVNDDARAATREPALLRSVPILAQLSREDNPRAPAIPCDWAPGSHPTHRPARRRVHPPASVSRTVGDTPAADDQEETAPPADT